MRRKRRPPHIKASSASRGGAMRSAHGKGAFLLLSSRYAYLISGKAVITRKTPKPISQGYQSRSRGEAGTTAPAGLMSPVALRHSRPVQRYWHMGNNGIGILQTATLTYALGDILRYWSMRLWAYYGSVIMHYAFMRLQAYCKRFSIAAIMRIILIANNSQ